MNSGIIKYLFYFVALVLLQLLILNHVHINGYFSPFFYIAFILFLPFDFPKWAVMLMGFLTGLVIDLFTYTPGLHASATVLLAYGRIVLLPGLSPRGDYEMGTVPSANQYGWGWFFRYTIILTLLHHLALFFVETFTFVNFYSTLLKALSATVITLFLLFLSQVSYKSR